ncbi:MAG: chemotaxis protein CheB [Bryobacteraceae bacterium]
MADGSAATKQEMVIAPDGDDGFRPSPSFPMVALGASAGGLEAFTKLLNNLPQDTGFAFILVQHLSPDQVSMLAQLLTPRSAMPVQQVVDGTNVEPNRVYIIPPNAIMTLRNGVLRLQRKARGAVKELAVDSFFRSLAAEMGSCAVGVVLSGSGSDGSLGLAAIKAEGGITFVEDPETARFDGMPRSAIATGCADFVLPVERIASELVRIAKHPYLLQAEGPASDAVLPGEMGMAKLLPMLQTAFGVDLSLYRTSTIKRRIRRRMALHRMENADEYVRFVEQQPPELHALYQDVLIKVTHFFRDASAFQGLRDLVFPALLRNRPGGGPLRIWVPACATGEEAYSIAISLLEYLAEQSSVSLPVQIFATDVSEDAIDKARAAIYLDNIALDVSPGRLKSFFLRNENGYQVSKVVRDMCVFARQDVIKDPPFSRLDLISCRNLLIYLEPPLQTRILRNFNHALNPNGYLMLGASESVTPAASLFSQPDKRFKVFMKEMGWRPLLPAPHHEMPSDRPPAEKRSPPSPGDQAGGQDIFREADRLVLSRYGPAGVIVNDRLTVIQFRGHTGAYLEPAPGHASLNILKMAREGLMVELKDALQQVKSTGAEVRRENIRIRLDGEIARISLHIVPLRASGREHYFLVLFSIPDAPPGPSPRAARKGNRGAGETETISIERLKQELLATREYLQSIIEDREATNEELQSANEEVLSAHEELQSINEEMETAKEELQSTNEELVTVNEEMETRNAESSRINDDLNNLLSSVKIPILMLGRDLRIRRFTPTAGRLLNLIAADTGRPIGDLRSGVDVPDLEEQILDVVENAAVRESEVRDREGVWYQMSIRPYRTADNRIDGAVIALHNIDDSKRAMERAVEARDLSQAIVEMAPRPLAVLDSNLRISTANATFYRLFELEPGMAAGALLFDLPGEWKSLTALQEALRKAAEGGAGIENLGVEFPKIGESPAILVFSARPIVVAGGTTRLILLDVQDVTESREREQELRASEGRSRRMFEKAFETGKDGLLLVDADNGEIREANQALADLLGYSREELAGKKLWEAPALHPIASGPAEFLDINLDPREMALICKAGIPKQVEIFFHPCREDGSMLQLTFRDITEQRSLEEQLRHSQRLEAMGRLSGMVAHDFNNMLTAIIGSSELILEQPGDEPGVRDGAENVLKAAQQAAALTAQLLTFSRRGAVQAQVIDPNDLLAEFEPVLRRLLGEEIDLTVEKADGVYRVRVDPGRVQQVLINLVVNARDAIPGRGRISIRTGNVVVEEDAAAAAPVRPGEYAQISVEDTGQGMAPETLVRIFEPFFTTKQRGRGTGLGLSTVYGIVKQSGGEILVQSELGRGTTFNVLLPAAFGREPEAPAEQVSYGPIEGTETVLLAEDDESVREITAPVAEARLHRSAGRRWHGGSGGGEPPLRRDPSVAFRCHDAAHARPRLFLSGYVGASTVPDEVEAGEVLQKPFHNTELLLKIREILDRGRNQVKARSTASRV